MRTLEDDKKKLLEIYKKCACNKELDKMFYSTGQPILYKKLLIYPVKTIYYIPFHLFCSCFFVNKYDSGIEECMGLNSLQFLFYQNVGKNIDNASIYLPLLEMLLLICLQKEEKNEDGEKTIRFMQDGKKCFIIIDNEKYNWKDFEKIRDIICEQNCVELPNYKIHPDIRKKLKEKDEILSNTNKYKVASFEGLLDCLMLAGHFSEDEVLDLSIRRFTNLLKRYDVMKNYDLLTLLVPNMDPKDRQNIMPWNSEIVKKDQYYSKITNIADIEKKIGDINKQ